jgi:hypothetical protein
MSQGTTNLSGSFTGSLLGTAATASYADNFTVSNTLTAQRIVVQTISSSVEFASGSNIFGSLSTNTHSFTGSVGITGSAAALLNVNNGLLYVSSSGNVGIGTINPDFGSYGATEKILGISNTATRARISFQNTSTGTTGVAGTLAFFNGSTALASLDVLADGATNSGAYVFYTNNAGTNGERMRITSAGNVGIGTNTPGNKLEVNGTGYFSSTLGAGGTISGGNISTNGTLSGANLSISPVLYATNLAQYQYVSSLAVIVPNALNASSSTADIRMYMVWATGFGDAVHGGARIWLIIMNGPGTDYTATELLARDTAGGTGLSISRSAVNQITVSGNGYGYIKSISCMQLISS